MGTRFGLRAGGFAATVACALLVGCGGGGGGGGGTTTPPTAAPIATPVLSPTSVSGSAIIAANVASAPATFTGVSNGSANVLTGGSVTLPTLSASNSVNYTLSGSLPSGVVAPSIRNEHFRSPKVLGVANTPIAYLQITFANNATITASPAFTFNFPAAISGNAYIVVSGSTIPNGWNEVAGPGVYSNANMTLTFAAVTQSPPITLSAGVVYTFALVTTGTGVIPTPTPVPTATPAPGTAATLPPVSASNGGYSPSDVASSLRFLVQSGYNGQGETVAIIGDMPPSNSDLSSYISTFQIPGNPLANYTVVNVPVTSPTTDTGGQQEAVLDVETVMGLAPGANIVFYNTQGDLSNQTFLNAENQVAASNGGNGPDVFSISFGGCEQYPLPVTPPGSPPPDAQVFLGMNAKHTAVTVSAGDEGDNCSTGVTPADSFGVDYPGSDPNVVSVGGNESDPAHYTLGNPVTWNDNFFSRGQGATGGGVSTTFAIPSFQAGFGGASTTYRNTPDIAFPAEGVSLILNGVPAEFGGTSWSAPQAAAMFAELDEYCGGRPPSNPVAWLYTAFTRSAANFLDITSGDNHWSTEAPTYSAHVGYDNNTGLGIPFAATLVTGATTGVCASKTWAGGLAAMSTQTARYESYGAARDTVLPFAERFNRSMDLGDRASNDQASVTLVLRRTSTAANDEQSVIAALKAAGFTITQTFPNHSLVQVSGAVSAVNRYFNTSIHNVSQGSYGTRYANATALTVPAAIAPYVNTVMADTLIARTPKHHRIW